MNVYVQHGSDLSADVIAGRTAHEGFYVRALVSPGPVERNAIVMGGAVATPARTHSADETSMRFRGARRSWNSPTSDAAGVSTQTHSDDRADVVQGFAPVDIFFAVDVVSREVLFENVAR
jgi:hypothetical protein